MVVSSGPDKVMDMNFGASDADNEYPNPYYKSSADEGQAGRCSDIDKDDEENWHDNITNHLLD